MLSTPQNVATEARNVVPTTLPGHHRHQGCRRWCSIQGPSARRAVSIGSLHAEGIIQSQQEEMAQLGTSLPDTAQPTRTTTPRAVAEAGMVCAVMCLCTCVCVCARAFVCVCVCDQPTSGFHKLLDEPKSRIDTELETCVRCLAGRLVQVHDQAMPH